MGTIVAKIKKGIVLLKLQKSNENIFEDVDYSAAIKYDGNLEKYDGWLKYQLHEDHKLFKKIDSAELSSIKINSIFEIGFFAYYDKGLFYFQKVREGNKILKKHFTLRIDKIKVEEPSEIVSINTYPDGIYDVNSKILYFRRVSDVTFLFPELKKKKETTTNQEIGDFFSSVGQIEIGDVDKMRLTTHDRQRIADVISEYSKLTSNQKLNLHKYIKNAVNNDLKYDKIQKKFIINNEKELRVLTYAFQHKIFKTSLDQESQVAIESTGIRRLLE